MAFAFRFVLTPNIIWFNTAEIEFRTTDAGFTGAYKHNCCSTRCCISMLFGLTKCHLDVVDYFTNKLATIYKLRFNSRSVWIPLSPSCIQYIACTLEGITCTVKTLAADHLWDSFQVVLWKSYFFVQLHRRRVGAPMKDKIFRRVGICIYTYRIVNMTLRHQSVWLDLTTIP